LVVDVSLGGDLTENHDQTSLGSGFASNLSNRRAKRVSFHFSFGRCKSSRTFDQGSSARQASRIASETWSQILSVG
jgi:hypothetical protein